MPTQVVILVGGKGKRLGDLTQQMPKPLLDVNGRPFLDYLIENFARFGFQEFLLLAGHCGAKIKGHYENNSISGVDIKVVIEQETMGTGGCLSLVKEQLHDIFLVSNGDSLFDFNFLALFNNFKDSGYVGSIALRKVDNPNRYGQVLLCEDTNIIEAFKEKSDSASQSGMINGGVYLFRKSILDSIPDGSCSMEMDVFPRLARDKKLTGKEFGGYFIDIGIPQAYALIQNEIQTMFRRPALLFDRDNTLTKDRLGYTHKVDELEWVEGAKESIRLCNDLGFYVFVVTNQAGIAKGQYDEEAVLLFHDEMQRQLHVFGAHIDDFVYCPHHPEGTVEEYRFICDCRKPAPGMLQHLDKEWRVDWRNSLLIGDKLSDISAAHAFGVTAHFYTGGNILVELKKALKLNDYNF